MKITELCPSPHIEALDCGEKLGDELVVTIKGVQRETVGAEKVVKGVVLFNEFDRGLVLNKTNSRTIAGLFGNDTDAWIGKKITIYRSETPLKGQVVPCVRVHNTLPSGNGHAKGK